MKPQPDYFKTGRPTFYKGIKMRSRTEARVAAVIDRLGGPWIYEGDAFASEEGQYLPDFVVGEIGDDPLVIEVKPKREMVPQALQKMLPVWDTDETAGLVVIATDSTLHSMLELRDGEILLFTFAIVDCQECPTASIVTHVHRDAAGLACPSCESQNVVPLFGEYKTVKETLEAMYWHFIITLAEIDLDAHKLAKRMGMEVVE